MWSKLRRRGTREGRGDVAPPRAGAPDAGHLPIEESAEHYVPATARVEPHGPLWKTIDVIVLLCVTGMVITVALQVLSRSFGDAISWTEEVTRFLFIYSAFLGMAAGFRHAEHARIAFVVAKLPQAGQRLAVHLYVLAGVAFFLIVGWKGWELTVQQLESEERSPVLGVGMYIATLPIVVSAVLAIVAHFQSVYRSPRLRVLIERGEMTSA